jgi:hypothetical protein
MSKLTANTQAIPQDLFTESSTQQLDLGAEVTAGDGRRYRYVLVGGTALVPGSLYQSPAETTSWQALAIASASAGATTITTTSTVTVTANQLVGGYVAISTGATAKGYLYKIKSHPAATAAVVTITLEDPLKTVLTAGTHTIDLIASPYSKVELWDYTNHDGMPVGVAVYPVTAAYYGWIQVGGPAALLIDSGNVGVGVNVYASAAVDGCGDATATYGFIGTAVTAGSSTENAIVNLNIN